MKKYNPRKIEKEVQKKWEKNKVYFHRDQEDKPKYYVLDMFPYPSGDGLHMGHTESYTASDIVYRYKKLQGFDVLHPQGFDSFGLPAENYAIKTGIHPKETTKKNTENYIRQMKMLGLGHDLNHLIYTSDPSYYKWTQWLFGKFFENGLVERKTDKINWCPSCNTGIANEQVENGKCERCKTEIEQKEVPGWFFKITDFAEDLIKDLDKVDWPEATKKNQRNWIGRSEGAKIAFKIRNQKSKVNENIEVFTTRPDTLFGATYLVLAPEHKLVARLLEKKELGFKNYEEVKKYVEGAKNKTEMERLESKEKTGVKLEGLVAINPANNEEIPIFVADYVLGGYGTGAIMAVPAHDERDFEFAKKYNLPIKEVIKNKQLKDKNSNIQSRFKIQNSKLFTGQGVLINSGKFNGIDSEEAKKAITEFVGGKMTINYRLRDWSISRQRYWGCPIPIVYNKKEKEKIKRQAFQINFYDQKIWKQLVGGIKTIETRALNPKEKKKYFGDIKKGSYIKAVNKKTGQEKYFQVRNVWKFKNLKELWETKKELLINIFPEKNIKNFQELKNKYKFTNDYLERINKNGLVAWEVKAIEPGVKFVGKENLPWLLPEDVDFKPTGTAPLAKSKELKERTEKLFGRGWTPEVDTMDTFVDSSWYFLRYPDPENEKEFCSREKLKRWLPVDLYIGGAEHTYMHLLYARFFVKAMHKMGLLEFDEPFLKLRHQGMVLDENGVKMSKSKGNVVNPDDMVEKFGADATRMYMMFAGPLEEDVMWKEEGVKGVYNFLQKIWRIFQEKNLIDCREGKSSEIDKKLPFILHKTIKGVTEDIEELKFNTAISKLMIFINTASRIVSQPQTDVEQTQKDAERIQSGVGKNILRGSASSPRSSATLLKVMENFLILLSPFAPHLSQYLWEQLGKKDFILDQKWPQYDSKFIQEETTELVIQVNGKVRDKIKVPADISEKEAKEKALASEKIKKYTEGKKIKKTIFVPGRLINLVV